MEASTEVVGVSTEVVKASMDSVETSSFLYVLPLASTTSVYSQIRPRTTYDDN